jgi:hypothetical protein
MTYISMDPAGADPLSISIKPGFENTKTELSFRLCVSCNIGQQRCNFRECVFADVLLEQVGVRAKNSQWKERCDTE